jgi:hypothetical protein
MNYKFYINLTTGIEGLIDLPLNPQEISFTRIQSTHCERMKLEQILDTLSSDLLLNLAIGTTCIVIDYGAKSHTSKVTRTALEWIRYYLTREWLNKEFVPFINQKNLTEIFEKNYQEISKSTKKKIAYFEKYVSTNKIRLIGFSKSTLNDSNLEFYKQIINEKLSKY